MEGQARSYMDTLTEQLSESEQAEMGRGGKLSFKGIPALEELQKICQSDFQIQDPQLEESF